MEFWFNKVLELLTGVNVVSCENWRLMAYICKEGYSFNLVGLVGVDVLILMDLIRVGILCS